MINISITKGLHSIEAPVMVVENLQHDPEGAQLTDKKKAILSAIGENPDATDVRLAEVASEKLPGDDTVSRAYVSTIKSDNPDLVEQYVEAAQEQTEEEPDAETDVTEESDEATSLDEEFENLTQKKKAIVDTIARLRDATDVRVADVASETLPDDETVSRAYVSMIRSDYPELIEHRDKQIEEDPEGTREQLTIDETTSEETADDNDDESDKHHIKPKESYHDLTDKMKAIVDAIAEDPDASDTKIAERASEILPEGESVSRAYVPSIRSSQQAVIDARIETKENERFEGEEKTTGDPFESGSLTASPGNDVLAASSDDTESDSESTTETASQSSGFGLDDDDSRGWQTISERPHQGGSETDEEESTAESTESTEEPAAETVAEAGVEEIPRTIGVAPPRGDGAVTVQIELTHSDVEQFLLGEVPDDIRQSLIVALVNKVSN